MRLHRPRIRTVAMGLGIAGLLAVAWHFWPQVYETGYHADRLTVYEGLPHPMYEEETFQDGVENQADDSIVRLQVLS